MSQTVQQPHSESQRHPWDDGWGSILASKQLGIAAVLVVLVVFIGAFNPGFLSADSLTNIGQRASWYGIMALGTVFLLAMGEIDLSIGSAYGFTIMAAALLMTDAGINPWVAGLLGIVAGMLLGGINGVLANVFRIPTIIITLGTLSAFRGMTLMISGSRSVYGVPRDQSFFVVMGSEPLGVPLSIWVFVGLALALSFLFRSTRYGFIVRAVGSNTRAAELAGMPTHKIRLFTLLLMGALVGISGMLTLGFFSTADPNLGTGYELQAIAAAIIGGTGLSGGRGTVIGAMLGALVIAVISSGITQFGVSANYSVFVTGVVIIIAVGVDALVRRRQETSS